MEEYKRNGRIGCLSFWGIIYNGDGDDMMWWLSIRRHVAYA